MADAGDRVAALKSGRTSALLIDTPIKKNDDVVDPLRYLFLARQDAPIPIEVDTDARELAKLNSVSRAAANEWDELIGRKGRYAKKPYIDDTLGRI